jgi:5-methyltetrahydrofolate--homocysteine methyltransferase
MSGELTKAVADLQEEEALKLTNEWLASGMDPNEVLVESRDGMELVGKRFGEGEYFLP